MIFHNLANDLANFICALWARGQSPNEAPRLWITLDIKARSQGMRWNTGCVTLLIRRCIWQEHYVGNRRRRAFGLPASAFSQSGGNDRFVPVSRMRVRSMIPFQQRLAQPSVWNPCVHSEDGRFLVSNTAALSARSATTCKKNAAPTSAYGRYPTSSIAITL
jgi:hypothetical protein